MWQFWHNAYFIWYQYNHFCSLLVVICLEYLFFNAFPFSLYVPLNLKWVSFRWLIVGYCFFSHSTLLLCLLIVLFNPFAFKVIFDNEVIYYCHLLIVWYLFCSCLSVFSSLLSSIVFHWIFLSMFWYFGLFLLCKLYWYFHFGYHGAYVKCRMAIIVYYKLTKTSTTLKNMQFYYSPSHSFCVFDVTTYIISYCVSSNILVMLIFNIFVLTFTSELKWFIHYHHINLVFSMFYIFTFTSGFDSYMLMLLLSTLFFQLEELLFIFLVMKI